MKKTFLLLLLLVTACTVVHAQKNKADEFFRLYQYDKAIPLYEKHLTDHPDDYKALKNLALSCQLTNDVERAVSRYQALVKLKESDAEDLYQLIQMLRIQQRIPEATALATEYKSKSPGPKANNLVESLAKYESFMSVKDDYALTNKTQAYKFSVYGASKYEGELLVTAENVRSTTSNWTGRGYTDLFLTDAAFRELKPFAQELMTKLDDGTPVFAANGTVMYYTSVHKDVLAEGSINTKKLKIATAAFDGTAWKATDQFPFNAVQYKTCHPAISGDGSLLVFSSDMPGGKGGMDLYLCKRSGNSWSQPVNLQTLNTSENELFPVFDQDDNLLFSSNGLPGLGGLDVYKADKAQNGFGLPLNIKAPFNSSYDDFYLWSDDHMNTGYLSSNRGEDPQIDDVFYFEKSTKPAVTAPGQGPGLLVKVRDKYTLTPLPYVSVTIRDQSGQIFHTGLTDPEGNILLDELPVGTYTIQGMLNEVSTTQAKVTEADFKSGKLIEKQVLHNDPRFTLAGIAVNTKTKAPLEGVTVQCTNVTNGIIKKMTTGKDGKFFFQLEQSSDFEVQGQKKGWLSSELAEKTTKGLDRSAQLYVDLELNIERPVSMGTITLKKIHYDYDKCNIRPDAAMELNRLVRLMNDYPDMNIELSSHTDARGSDAYNLKLSQCRADSAVAYLISQGIPISRMNAKGYGETKLVNGCSNGVECTDKKHEENRRTEFTILSCPSCPALKDE
jgi:outer membrane protein OmpA-like peptidoglycan-associated protein